MWVCKVDVGGANTDEAGNPEALQIVCGAQNFDAGDKIPVAMVGAVMPEKVEIARSCQLRHELLFSRIGLRYRKRWYLDSVHRRTGRGSVCRLYEAFRYGA
ncbi:MAG: hypothetical protein RSD80_05695 [Raoultibacter sp.]